MNIHYRSFQTSRKSRTTNIGVTIRSNKVTLKDHRKPIESGIWNFKINDSIKSFSEQKYDFCHIFLFFDWNSQSSEFIILLGNMPLVFFMNYIWDFSDIFSISSSSHVKILTSLPMFPAHFRCGIFVCGCIYMIQRKLHLGLKI